MMFFSLMPNADADLGGLQHFNDLRKHPGCTDIILDLLDFIETDLLRMDPNNRAKISDIVAKVRTFHQQCEADISYCTNRMKPVTTRVQTDLSELEASVPSFSLEMQERLRQTVVNREGDSKAELGDLGADPVEAPGSPTQSKRRRASTQKGKEPERMPTVEEVRTPMLAARHSMYESQQPLPEIAVNDTTKRHDQPQQSEASTELFAQTEMAQGLDRGLRGLQRGGGPRHGQVGIKDGELATIPAVDPPHQPVIANFVLPPNPVFMALPDQFQNSPSVLTWEQGLRPPGEGDVSEDHGSASTAITTTIQDPVGTTKTSQPPGTVDTPMAQLPVVNQRLLSKPHADPSSIHTGDAQDGDSGSHPQEGEQRCSHEANARQHGQRTGNAPPRAAQLTGNGESVRPAGRWWAVKKPAADHLHNGSAKTAVNRRTSFQNILQSLLCCVPNTRR